MKSLIHNIRRHFSETILVFLLIAGVCGIMNCAVPNDKAPTGIDESPGQTAIYPHSSIWSRWTEHGSYTIEQGAPACQQCHGDNYRGGSSGVSCYQCHDYPHTSSWAKAAEHGLEVIDKGTDGCATICHGTDFKGGDTGSSCFACHKFYPHSVTWGVTHKDAVDEDKTKSCATLCHGSDLGGGDSGVACTDCHAPDDDIFNSKGNL